MPVSPVNDVEPLAQRQLHGFTQEALGMGSPGAVLTDKAGLVHDVRQFMNTFLNVFLFPLTQ